MSAHIGSVTGLLANSKAFANPTRLKILDLVGQRAGGCKQDFEKRKGMKRRSMYFWATNGNDRGRPVLLVTSFIASGGGTRKGLQGVDPARVQVQNLTRFGDLQN